MQRRKRPVKVCSFCRKNPRRPNQRTCHDCHSSYMQASRARDKEARS